MYNDAIDAHVHLFSKGLFEEFLATQPPGAYEHFHKALKERRVGRAIKGTLVDLPAPEVAAMYTAKLEAAGVEQAVIMANFENTQWMRDFLAHGRGRLHALCTVDPRKPGAAELLTTEIEAGYKGVKLYPVNRAYSLSAPECRPFFERANELKLPIVIHYGVSVDTGADLRFADPIDLSPVARDFPDITFIIAHFGAGWFDSVLRLAYQCKNVYVDSSGTNNWMDYYSPRSSLGDIFERALTAVGPERILFGTDSNNAAPYRTWIRWMQEETIRDMGILEQDVRKIMRGNAIRVFGLEG